MMSSFSGRPCTVGKTILLVDDEPDVRRILERMLRSLGFVVLSASSGNEALSACRQNDGPVHLLVTDLEMPEMDGRELADRLRRHRPDIGVLFLSGHADDLAADDDMSADSGAYLQKPCTLKELADHVTRLADNLTES